MLHRCFVSVLCVFILTFALGRTLAAYCNGKPSPDAKPNLYPFFSSPPTLVAATQNGKLFKIGPDPIYILHLWGTPYQMGHAQGTLLQSQIRDMNAQVWKYVEEQAIKILKSDLPWWLQELIADAGLQGALEAMYFMTKGYTGSYIYEEIQGISDASGIPFFRLAQMHMISELTSGGCSLIGAWGDATARIGGGTVQLRALDWDVTGPFKNFPLITVYHSNRPDMNSFINIGFMAYIGSLTGISDAKLGISEIGVSFPDNTFSEDDYFGIPFAFLLRDILQWDRTYEDALNRIINAARTCRLILAVGDGNARTARAVQYSHSFVRIFDDRNLLPYNETWHPRVKNVVYYGMDWLCPNYDIPLLKQIRAFYGNISVENIARYMTSIVQTGDLHIGIYDLTNMKLLVSFARQDGRVGPLNAYNRQFYELDANALFNVPPPTEDEITHPIDIPCHH
jgi:isopenicillin-N N-acyltransferase-like protein